MRVIGLKYDGLEDLAERKRDSLCCLPIAFITAVCVGSSLGAFNLMEKPAGTGTIRTQNYGNLKPTDALLC